MSFQEESDSLMAEIRNVVNTCSDPNWALETIAAIRKNFLVQEEQNYLNYLKTTLAEINKRFMGAPPIVKS